MKRLFELVNQKENMLNAMPDKKCKTLGDINDILIVRKITERESTNLSAEDSLEEETSFKNDLDREQHLLAEEHEAIVRKQLQLLQADERGKQALISEIAAIKQKQEKRAELLRFRQHALNIEKERARKIALLPPPLPKSVKLLLKKCDEPKPDKPDVQMPDELTVCHIKGVESYSENKENILDPEELEAREKMQGEWQMKAKKRFNEALKKDRQKEEYSKIMKQIHNSELRNRLEMAKSISSEKKCIPCPLSDKFQTVKKQTDMEDAAEKVFRKMNKREHVIEDIEGYQDHYEEKYRKIDSHYEHKMIDCVPNFVKENYEYLLEDESKFQGGKNFSGLEDSINDVLNEAYIEYSTDPDTLDGREKIDLAINQLDKLRSDLQTEYDKTLKPLLLASADIPKKELSDKAVEAELLKLPVEDKAVETDILYGVELTTPPTPPPCIDFSRSGVMAFKRRLNGHALSSFRGMYVPDMHKRDVLYSMPPVTQSEILTPSSWSSSSYCSLPSKHGIPSFPNVADSIKCDICVAEMEKDFPPEVSQDSAFAAKGKCDKSKATPERAQLSEYVQQLAKKYLVAKSTSSQTAKGEVIKPLQGHSYSSLSSNTETMSSAFEREIIPKSKIDFRDPQMSERSILATRKDKVQTDHSVCRVIEKTDIITRKDPDPCETLVKQDNILERTQENLDDDIYNKIKNTESTRSPVEYSEYEMEAKRIQLIKQILTSKIPRFSLDLSLKTEDPPKDKQEVESTSLPEESGMRGKPHIYHELSTIQEMDSALTAGSIHTSLSKLSDSSVIKDGKESVPKEVSNENLEVSPGGLKKASLLDPPDTSIAELAKSIHFVTQTQEEAVQPQIISSECLDAASVTPKEDALTSPPLISDSSSSVSLAGKMFTSSLVGNLKYSNLKDTKPLPQYFSDVSDIPTKVSSSEKYGLSPSLLSSEFLSSVFSSPLTGSSPSIPSSMDEESKKKKDTAYTLISGFIDSPASSASQSIPHETEVKSKGDKDTLISGFIDSPVPLSSQPISSMIEPNLEDKKHNIPSLVSGYIDNFGTSNESGSRIFRAMTPHFDVSSPSVKSNTAENQSDTSEKNFIHGKHFMKHGQQFKSKEHTLVSGDITSSDPFSQHSVSSEVDPKLDIKKNFPLLIPGYIENFGTSDESGSRIFRPMTPHSDISSPGVRSSSAKHKKNNVPSLISGYADNFGTSDESDSRIFRPMTPHYDISSPGVKSSSAKHRSDIDEEKGFASSKHSVKYVRHIPLQSSNSSEDFQVMTPHSYVSSPSERADYHGYSSSAENFKALTPMYMESSPSLPGDEAKFKLKNISSGSSEFYPMNVRLDISTNSVSSDSSDNQSNAIKKLPHLNYHFTLKTQVPGQPKYLESFKQSKQKVKSAVSEKKIYHITESHDNILIQGNDSDEIKAKVCTSDFFVPQFCADDLSSVKTDNKGSLEKDTFSEEIVVSHSKPKSTADSQKAVLSEAAYWSSQNEGKKPK